MLNGVVSGLIIAWLLSLFGVDTMFIETVQTFVVFEVTVGFYYLVFAIIGLIGGLVKR